MLRFAETVVKTWTQFSVEINVNVIEFINQGKWLQCFFLQLATISLGKFAQVEL